VHQSEDVLRPPEVAQPMNSEVSEFGAVGQPVEDQVPGRPGQHDLAAVRYRTQPGTAVNRLAEVAFPVAPLRLRGVQSDAQCRLIDGALDV
jgi:hypothetical protein